MKNSITNMLKGSLIVFLLLVGACAGDSDTSDHVVCTMIACTDGFFLELVPMDERFSLGEYDVYLTAEDYTTFSCSFAVYDDLYDCGYCLISEDCDESGSSIWVGAVRFSIDYPVIEGTLNVQVDRDGIEVANGVFDAVYEIIQPNGPDCEPTCTQYSAELIVD